MAVELKAQQKICCSKKFETNLKHSQQTVGKKSINAIKLKKQTYFFEKISTSEFRKKNRCP